jgi:uncharacterized protein YhfF
MTLPPQIEAFWQAYLATRGDLPPPPLDPDPVWQFGDLEAAGRVGQLANQGIKTTTSALLWELTHEGVQLPQVGDYAIVADGVETPICIIEVTEVAVKPFNEVDAQFAYDYGEYGRTLEQWRAASWEYFSEVCARIGREPSEMMPMVCQRFRRVYPQTQTN